jgi:hypothetical protein
MDIIRDADEDLDKKKEERCSTEGGRSEEVGD